MPCYHPIFAFKSLEGKKPRLSSYARLLFEQGVKYSSSGEEVIRLPCSKCVGCRLESSRQWAIRCMHEASLYEKNCFITLTFSDENLPKNSSLDESYFQKFMKRLRKKFVPLLPKGISFEERKALMKKNWIRYYHCGEYGSKFSRPHYHACLFNFDFPDKVLWKEVNGQKLYVSNILSDLWPYGYSTIGSVNFDSAAYVARYVMKKVNGSAAKDHYKFVNPDTGECVNRKPEYTTMSRRPGIGRGWFDKYKSDVFPSDQVIVKGKACKPPKYYDRLFEKENPFEFVSIKDKRCFNAEKRSKDSTLERLAVREKCQEARVSRLFRSIE